MTQAAAAPTLISLVICDQVIDDRMTNKKSAIGLFNTIFTPTLPMRIQQFAVMATLTEITSRTPLELRLVRDADNEALLRTEGSVTAPSPLAMVDLVFSLHGARLEQAGQYAFELWTGNQLLGRRRFHVVQRAQTPPAPPQNPPEPA